MITATIPNRFVPERRYVLRVLIEVCLGGKVDVQVADVQNVALALPTGETLVVADAFWRHVPEADGYLFRAPLPGAPQAVHHERLIDAGLSPNIVALYGNGSLQEGSTADPTKHATYLGADLLASAFYLLTGWAEWAEQQPGHPLGTAPDAHGRYPEANHWLVRHECYLRPLVEEYAAFIRSWAAAHGYRFPALRHATVLPTHDIDRWRLGSSWHKRLWINLHQVAGTARYADYLLPRQILTGRNDPYAGYDFFLQLAHEAGLTPYYFFKSTQAGTAYDDAYPLNRPDVQVWSNRAVGLGFHPGYEAAVDWQYWQWEYRHVASTLRKPSAIRGHFLKERIPETWRWAEVEGISWDSTRGFSTRSGFRTGMCRPYPLYDFLARRTMRLWEAPLLFMESAHLPEGQRATWPSPGNLYRTAGRIQAAVQRFGGQFVFNWHNDHVRTPPYAPYEWVLRALYALPS